MWDNLPARRFWLGGTERGINQVEASSRWAPESIYSISVIGEWTNQSPGTTGYPGMAWRLPFFNTASIGCSLSRRICDWFDIGSHWVGGSAVEGSRRAKPVVGKVPSKKFFLYNLINNFLNSCLSWKFLCLYFWPSGLGTSLEQKLNKYQSPSTFLLVSFLSTQFFGAVYSPQPLQGDATPATAQYWASPSSLPSAAVGCLSGEAQGWGGWCGPQGSIRIVCFFPCPWLLFPPFSQCCSWLILKNLISCLCALWTHYFL